MDRSKSEKSMFSTAAATSGPASRVCRVPDWVSWSTSKLWNIHHESRSFMIICYGFSMNFRLFFSLFTGGKLLSSYPLMQLEVAVGHHFCAFSVGFCGFFPHFPRSERFSAFFLGDLEGPYFYEHFLVFWDPLTFSLSLHINPCGNGWNATHLWWLWL